MWYSSCEIEICDVDVNVVVWVGFVIEVIKYVVLFCLIVVDICLFVGE